MNCQEAVAALIASMESGTPMTDDARKHVAECDRCSVLLHSARELQSSLQHDVSPEPSLEPAAARAGREVVRTSRQRIVLRALGVLLVLAVLLGLSAVGLDAAEATEGTIAVVIGLAIAIFIAIPILIILGVARAIVRPSNGRPLYKRLGPGRMLSGVALGIADATNLSVNVVRLLFFGLVFFDGVGLILYVLLTLFMPVHPEDRQYMWRFQLRRWFRSGAGNV